MAEAKFVPIKSEEVEGLILQLKEACYNRVGVLNSYEFWHDPEVLSTNGQQRISVYKDKRFVRSLETREQVLAFINQLPPAPLGFDVAAQIARLRLADNSCLYFFEESANFPGKAIAVYEMTRFRRYLKSDADVARFIDEQLSSKSTETPKVAVSPSDGKTDAERVAGMLEFLPIGRGPEVLLSPLGPFSGKMILLGVYDKKYHLTVILFEDKSLLHCVKERGPVEAKWSRKGIATNCTLIAR